MKISAFWSDGAIVQRGKPIIINGTSSAMHVIGEFLGRSWEFPIDAQNNFTMVFPPQSGSFKPHTLRISDGIDSVFIQNIVFGDVWVLSGQSNMELPISRTLDHTPQNILLEEFSHIRRFRVPLRYNFHMPEPFIENGWWESVTEQTIMHFSATGYFFAREIHLMQRIPVGIIETAIGGTPIEAWMSEATLRRIGKYEAALLKNTDDFYIQNTQAIEGAKTAEWHRLLDWHDKGYKDPQWYSDSCNDSTWNTLSVPGFWLQPPLDSFTGSVWFRTTFFLSGTQVQQNKNKEAILRLGAITEGDEAYVNSIKIGHTDYRYPPRKYRIPAGLLREGINTVVIRIFVTGTNGCFMPGKKYCVTLSDFQEISLEGSWKYCIGTFMPPRNCITFFQYEPVGLFNAMIFPLKDLGITGVAFYQGESNSSNPAAYADLFEKMVSNWRTLFNQGSFPFLYVQLSNYSEGKKSCIGKGFAQIRDVQRRCLLIENTAMVVTIDVGEYNDLHPQNKETVGKRLSLAARKLAYREQIVHSGPLLNQVLLKENEVNLSFTECGHGLIARDGRLCHFALHYSDGSTEEIIPQIRENNLVIILHSKSFLSAQNPPVKISYAFEDNPEKANLYNKDGLPASPFIAEIISTE